MQLYIDKINFEPFGWSSFRFYNSACLFFYYAFYFSQFLCLNKKNHKSQTTVEATPYIQISPEVPPAAGKKKKKKAFLFCYVLLFPLKYLQWTLVTEKKMSSPNPDQPSGQWCGLGEWLRWDSHTGAVLSISLNVLQVHMLTSTPCLCLYSERVHNIATGGITQSFRV